MAKKEYWIQYRQSFELILPSANCRRLSYDFFVFCTSPAVLFLPQIELALNKALQNFICQIHLQNHKQDIMEIFKLLIFCLVCDFGQTAKCEQEARNGKTYWNEER